MHLRAAEENQNGFWRYFVTNKVTLWAASSSACVVYTKTIIHLSVGESGGYTAARLAQLGERRSAEREVWVQIPAGPTLRVLI